MNWSEMSDDVLKKHVCDAAMPAVIKSMKLPDFKLTVFKCRTVLIGRPLFSSYLGKRDLFHCIPTPMEGQIEVAAGTKRVYIPKFGDAALDRLKLDRKLYREVYQKAFDHAEISKTEEHGQRSMGAMSQRKDELVGIFKAHTYEIVDVNIWNYGPIGKLGLLRSRSTRMKDLFEHHIKSKMAHSRDFAQKYLMGVEGDFSDHIVFNGSQPRFYEFGFEEVSDKPIKVAAYESSLKIEDFLGIPTMEDLEKIIALYDSVDKVVENEDEEEEEDDDGDE